MDPTSVALLYILFRTAEKLVSYAGGKVADSLSKPIWDALENKALWYVNQDDTAKRWQAFTQAFKEAKQDFVQTAPDTDLAQRVVNVLEDTSLPLKATRSRLDQIVSELERSPILTDKPNVQAIANLIVTAMDKRDGLVPSPVAIADTINHFVSVFQDKLFSQPAYTDLLLKKKEWEQLRKIRYDTPQHYLAQLVELHQDLEFVGIPELRDKLSIFIDDIFIQLQAETEAEPNSPNNMRSRVSVNDALGKNTQLVILGDPGAGKTTLLKYITLAFAQRQCSKLQLEAELTPIFVRLYDYVAKRVGRGQDYSLIDYLYTHARESLMVILEPGFFEDELRRGNCCVCLDGLDELGEAGLRREITNIVAALVNRYPNNRYIVTSRIVGYAEAPLDRRRFAHFTVLPFAENEIKEFVTKWYSSREKDLEVAYQRSLNLIKTIMDEPRIRTLATNPLMLTIIALVHRIEAELPHERVKLYDKCVTTLVETWDKVKGVSEKDRQRPYYRLRRRLLEQLAFWMHSQPGLASRVREIKEGDLELYLALFLAENPKLNLDDEDARQEAHAFIELTKARTGLIAERGEGVYSFAHLTFQEYLAATDIEHRLAHSIDAIWAEIQPRLFDSHWYEVILLLLGCLNKFEKHPTEIVKRILSATDKYEAILHRHLFFATRILADRVEVDKSLYETITSSLIDIVRYDPLARGDAITAITLLVGDDQLARSLSELSRNAQVDIEVRIDAARALGEMNRTDEALILLTSIARNGNTPSWMRRRAVEALGILSSTVEATNSLQELAIEQSDHVSIDAAEVLGRIGNMDMSLSLLLAMVRNRGLSNESRFYAMQALGKLGRFDVLENLGSAVNTRFQREWDENEPWIKTSAQRVLQQYRSLYHEHTPLPELLDISRKKLTINYGGMKRLLPTDKLGVLGDQSALLLELALDKQVPQKLRSDAIFALGQLGESSERVVDGLMSVVRDNKIDLETRSYAAGILAELGQADDLMIILLNIAQNSNVEKWTREKVMEAVSASDYTDGIAAILFDIANDSQIESSLRCDAARVLGQSGRAKVASELLFSFATDVTFEGPSRQRAYQALKTILGAT